MPPLKGLSTGKSTVAPKGSMGPLRRLFDLLDRPSAIPMAETLYDLFSQGEQSEEYQRSLKAAKARYSAADILETAALGKLPTKREEKRHFADFLERKGVPELGSLSVSLPTPSNIYSQLKGEKPKGASLDITGRGALGFVGDVAGDPLTYMTGGASAGIKAGGRALTAVGKQFLKSTAKEFVPRLTEQMATKGIKLSEEAISKAAQVHARRALEALPENKLREMVSSGPVIKILGKEIPLGTQDLKYEFIPAVRDKAGKIYKGVPGQTHTEIAPKGTEGATAGFIDRTGQFLKAGEKEAPFVSAEIAMARPIEKPSPRGWFARAFGSREAGLTPIQSDIMAGYHKNIQQARFKEVGRLGQIFGRVERNDRVLVGEALREADDVSSSLLRSSLAKVDATAAERLDVVRRALDEDMPLEEFIPLKRELDKLLKKAKTAIPSKKKYDMILSEAINKLPQHLRKPARETWTALRQAEKKDLKQGLLSAALPNYVPRPIYEGILGLSSRAGKGPGGGFTSTLGRFARHRKIITSKDAKEYVQSMGGKWEDDIAIPVFERLLRGVRVREKAATTMRLLEAEGGKLPANVVDHLERLNVGRGTEESNTLLKALGTVTNFYKGAYTSLFLSFHVRNTISNAFMTVVGTGASVVRPSVIRAWLDVSRGKRGLGIVTDLGERVSSERLTQEIAEQGVRRGFLLNEVQGKLSATLQKAGLKGSKERAAWALKHPMEAAKEFGQQVEGTARSWAYVAFRKKGLSPKEASKAVDDFLFDYDNLTTFEKRAMRVAYPFYTFYRKAAEQLATELIRQPRVFSGVDKFLRFLSDNDLGPAEVAQLPDYLQNRLLIKVGPNKYITGLELGWDGVLNILANPKEGAGMLNFIPKAILEQAIGYDIFRQMPLTEAAQYTGDIPKLLSEGPAGKALGFTKDVTGKTISTQPRLLHLLRTLPSSRATSTAAWFDKPNTLEQIIRAGTGFQTKTISKKQQERLKQTRADEEDVRLGKKKYFKKAYTPKKK